MMRLTKSDNCIRLLVAGLLLMFAVSLGGCGGNSSSVSQISDADLDLPTMFDIRATPEFSRMMDELKAEGVRDKVDKLTFYNVYEYLTPEQLEEILQEIPEEDREFFRLANQMNYEELVNCYNNGGVLILFHPSEETIRQAMRFLDSVSEDISLMDISTDIELYALTKQTVSGYEVNERNIVQLENIFTYVIPDISTLVSLDEYSSPDDIEHEYIEFQVERWRKYYYWLADLSDKARENFRTASEIKASAAQDNNIVQISRVLTGTYDWSYSKSFEWDEVKMSPDNTPLRASATKTYMSYSGSRTNILDYRIYSVHSFTDHSDYFLIKTSMYTKPQGSGTFHMLPPIRPGVFTRSFPYLRGYTLGNSMRFALKRNSYSFGEFIQTSTPESIYDVSPYRETFTWTEEGMFAGHDFGAFDGMSFSEAISFDAANMSVRTTNSGTYAGINAVFDKPIEDSLTESGFSAYPASIEEKRLPFFAVLQVERDEWEKGYDNVQLEFQGSVQEGAVIGNYYYTSRSDEYTRWPRIDAELSRNFTLNIKKLNPPMHSTVHQRNYAFNVHGDMVDASVRVYSETDWQLVLESTASDWVILDKTSGTATGPEGEWIHFSVPENTSGSGRFAKIMLIASPYDDKSKTESTIIDIFQSNNEGFSAD